MAFSLKTWVDRISEFPNRRKLDRTGITDTYDVTRSEGKVSVEGNKFNASEMNDLENRISTEFTTQSNSLAAHTTDTSAHVTLLSCARIGTVQTIQGTIATSGLMPCVLVVQVNSTYVSGDTFKVNGVAYTAQTSSGTALASGTFAAGAKVNVTLDVTNKIISFPKLGYTAADIGLGNVDNTHDANKSVNYANTAGSAPANGGTASYAYNAVEDGDTANPRVHNQQFSQTDLTAGVSPLATGRMYWVYE